MFSRLLATVLVCISVGACGGSSPTAPTNNNPPTQPTTNLTVATGLTDFVQQIRQRYNFDLGDFVAPYDHPVSDFPAAERFLGTTDPMAGVWTAGPTVQFPTPSGRSTFGAITGSVRRVSYSAVDLSNGLVLEGQYQAFWGVQDLTNNSGLEGVPIVIIVEGIVSLSGVPKYRGVQVVRGTIYRTPFTNSGVVVRPTSFAISGQYVSDNIQTIDTSDPRVPARGSAPVQYASIWLKQ